MNLQQRIVLIWEIFVGHTIVLGQKNEFISDIYSEENKLT